MSDLQYEFSEESGRSLKDYLNILRRRKLSILYTAIVVLLISVLAAFLWPPTYKSESVILIEQQEIPADLVRSTITSYAQQRIEQIKQRIMTIGNIMEIVEEFKIYDESDLERKTRTEIAQEFRKAVSIEPISAEVVDPRSGRPSSAVIAFSLAYTGDKPAKVQKVTSEITELYLQENLKERREESASTSEFLENEAQQLQSELEKIDTKIAEFKTRNAGALPEQKDFNRTIVERTSSQIDSLGFMLAEMKKQKVYLESELAQLSPTAPVTLATGAVVLGDADRLKAIDTQLRQFEAQYSDIHPTVKRLKREKQELIDQGVTYNQREEQLTQLRLEKDRLAALESRYTDPNNAKIRQSREIISTLEQTLKDGALLTEEKPDNPAYLVIANQLAGIEADINTNTKMLAELSIKLEEHEQHLSRTPELEKELQNLVRDYQSMNRRYQEIHSKQLSAELARNLETERKGERFTLIQPPEFPREPVSPNRPAIVVLGFMLALLTGVGAAIAKEMIDEGVYGSGQILAATGEAPLIVVGYMENQEEKATHNKTRLYWLLGLIVFAVIAVICFHSFVKPLDVAWFMLMRRLGLQ